MDGRELAEKLNYTEFWMEKAIRKLALKDNMATAEEIAIMSKLEVCNLITQKYEIVMSDSDHVLLVPTDKMSEFENLAVFISR